MGRILKELGIELICAHSPQAKGRVERRNGVLQDRLVKALRLAGIATLEEANRFVEDEYLVGLDARFQVAPAGTAEGRRRWSRGVEVAVVRWCGGGGWG